MLCHAADVQRNYTHPRLLSENYSRSKKLPVPGLDLSRPAGTHFSGQIYTIACPKRAEEPGEKSGK